MYSQISHSMLDFASMGMPDDPPASYSSRKGKGKEGTPVMTPVSPTRSPPPRRRSLPDMSGMRAPPPPYPKFSVREEEGREVLPPYSCRIHFEASLMRKMEFSSPGILAKDRAWKRVYIILNGTGLWIFKQNPRSHPVRQGMPRGSNSSVVHPPGGRKGDGVVHVKDVAVGAPHVHLPEEVLVAATVRPGSPDSPLRKSSSRTSSGNSGESRRRSMDGSRRSVEMRAGPSRSSMSSSINTGMSSSTTLTTPDESEKARITPLSLPGSASVLGQARPSNSQSARPHAGSHILASFQSNTVLRLFSLQNAETGLASDYHKRKNVIRVRADGEQFLIQADNVLMAIDWIEVRLIVSC